MFGASHVYGTLSLSDKKTITIKNITDYNVKYIGERLNLEQPLTVKEALKLDKVDGGDYYMRLQRQGDIMSERFRNIDEIVVSAKKKYKELKLDCPMIILYNGEKFSGTQIFYSKDI